ncbi:hypothetical protein GQ44DRAFT_719585 [Phaeosphaeriaceae sp. PMI808]|nr:hypothetical protein GQ44DRAFT_719585 [Phaeosphaeriaceae sp. PMI808]
MNVQGRLLRIQPLNLVHRSCDVNSNKLINKQTPPKEVTIAEYLCGTIELSLASNVKGSLAIPYAMCFLRCRSTFLRI